MPSKDKFDDILKNKFNEFEAPLPKGGFGAIKDRMPERKRRGFIVPFLAAASIFFATLSGYLLHKQYNTKAPEKEIIVIRKDSKSNKALSQNNTSTNAEQLNNVQNGNLVAQGNHTQESSLVQNNNESANAVNLPASSTNQTVILTESEIIEAVNNGNLVTVITKETSAIDNLSPLVDNMNPALIRSIILAQTDIVSRDLNGPIDVVLVETYTDEEENKEEEKTSSRLHYGISAAPIYTSKTVSGNLNDDVFITQFNETNKLSTQNVGFNTGVLFGYDLGKKLQIYSKMDVSNIRDENTFEVTEKLDAPQLLSTDGNSMILTATKTSEVNLASSFLLGGLNTGLKYRIGKSTYVNLGSGAHYLLAYNQNGDAPSPANNKLNFSSSFALGKEYTIGNNLFLNVEPEIKGFFRNLQKDGLIQSTPYTLGINLILLH